jgi:hypothetical protein
MGAAQLGKIDLQKAPFADDGFHRLQVDQALVAIKPALPPLVIEAKRIVCTRCAPPMRRRSCRPRDAGRWSPEPCWARAP